MNRLPDADLIHRGRTEAEKNDTAVGERHRIHAAMNELIRLNALALKDTALSPQTRETLEKTGAGLLNLSMLIGNDPEQDLAGSFGTTAKEAAQLELESAGLPGKEEIKALEGHRVLIADDIRINAEILAYALSLEGVVVDIAENGLEAVNLFTQHEEGFYSAILMDLRMPVMDGLTATKTIRRMSRSDAGSIPIIAITAYEIDERLRTSLLPGVSAYLAKPVDADHLFETLRQFV